MTAALLQARLREVRGHVSPFLVLGDPTPALSVELACAAVAAGASMLELGLPYSDPCADGPAIQAACRRALAAGTTVRSAFAAMAEVAARCPDVPRNLLVYGNLVHASGLATFCRGAAAAGASSLLVPDIPLGEDAPLRDACSEAEIGHVRLVGPRTSAARIAASGEGAAMVYVAALQGVTGSASGVELRAALLDRVRAATSAPMCLGFGLTTAEDCASAFAHGARVAVVGSHLARVIDAHGERLDELPERLGRVVAALMSVTTPNDARRAGRCSSS